MVRKVGNPRGENRNLHFARTCIAFVKGVFLYNFLFVYLGNLLGGSIFVAGFYSLGYRRQAREQEGLKIQE